MKRTLTIGSALMFLLATFSYPNGLKAQELPSSTLKSRVVEDGGTGPFKAVMLTDSSLPTHTIFRPKDMSAFKGKNKLPIIVWGNGACANSPWEHVNFLSEIASHGFFIIAVGPIPVEGEEERAKSTSSKLTDAIDWAFEQDKNTSQPYYQTLNLKKIAVSGMSCGGLQALEVSSDPRVSALGVFNSGIFNTPGNGISNMPNLTKENLKLIHTPVIYMLGGEKDIAYKNGMDDYANINHVPIFLANLNVGHGGTYRQAHGGEFARVATDWYKWQLKDDKKAASIFKGDLSKFPYAQGWKVERKNIK